MTFKIVFNGTEYASVDAMPPDVRREYEVALQSLRQAGDGDLLSLLQETEAGGRVGATVDHTKATFREIVVNGKKYDSVDAMPPDVRRVYEQALARMASGGSTAEPAPGRRSVQTQSLTTPVPEERQGGRGWRILLWIALGALAAWLLLRRG